MKLISAIAAKSDSENSQLWLPFKIHALDTAAIIGKLFNCWLSESERELIIIELADETDKESGYEIALNYCRFLALIHDIGKITPIFQCKITLNIESHREKLCKAGLLDERNGIKAKGFSHAAAGYITCKNELGLDESIAEVVGLHHGSAIKSIEYDMDAHANYYYGYGEQKPIWKNLRQDWLEYSLKETGFGSIKDLPRPSLKASTIITALLIMSDWIASNTEYFKHIEIGVELDKTAINDRANNAWEILGLPEPWEPKSVNNCNDYFVSHFGFEANLVQNDFFKAVSENLYKGLYILEAPMGVGKTEAALSAAENLAARFGLGGIYFGLPTQATANGIFERISNWAEKCDDGKHSIRLAHGMAELNDRYKEFFRGTVTDVDDETNVFVHEWFEGRKQALLSDFVIATVDQFLLASLKQKHFMLRHLGLAGKVVIIDECHSYDTYMSVYLDSTLAWMGAYKVPVIILSATLPPKRRDELIKAYFNFAKDIDIEDNAEAYAYPVLTYTCGDKKAKRRALSSDGSKHEIKVTRICDEEIVSRLTEKLSNGGCAGVIVNTVHRAQSLAKEIESAMPDYTVICFHSKFIATDRAKTENKLLSLVGKNSDELTRNKLIVVGTQVIEQSLDLDFDYMVTDLCPMDLLLQRSGRLHRHHTSKRTRPTGLENAELSVNFIEENPVYSRIILDRTKNYLPKKIVIPQDIPKLVAKVYDEEELLSDEEYKRARDDKKTKAEKYCIPASRLKSKRASLIDLMINCAENSEAAEASVRDGSETIEVLVLRKESESRYALMSGKKAFDTLTQPDDSESRLIAGERIRLPAYFAKEYMFNKTIKDLENMPEMWKNSKWLRKELLLLFDKKGEAEIAGIRLKYTEKYGLESFFQQRKEV